MSNWITENKPAAVITGVALVLVLGLGAFGYLESSKQGETDKKIAAAKKAIDAANKAEFTPTSKVEKELNAAIKTYQKSLASIKDSYAPFLATSKLDAITPNVFKNKLNADREAFIKLCKDKGIQVNDNSSWFGFQDYGNMAPSTQATPTLNFELKAITQLANELATNCELTQFIKIHRKKVNIEKPVAAETSDEEPVTLPWESMTFEIAVKGKRQMVIKAINTILNNKNYLFAIDNLRVRNERVIAPVITLPEKEKKAETSSTGLTLAPAATPGTEEGQDDPQAPAIEEILKPISGSEQIFAQFTVNLIHFNVNEKKAADSEDAE